MNFIHATLQRELLKSIGSYLKDEDVLPIFYKYINIYKRTEVFDSLIYKSPYFQTSWYEWVNPKIIPVDLYQVKRLFRLGVKSNLEETLVHACRKDNLDLVKFLIEEKSNVNCDSLKAALYVNNIDLIKFLFDIDKSR